MAATFPGEVWGGGMTGAMIARLVMLSRWLLAPLFLGLILALLVLVVAFFLGLWRLVVSLPTARDPEILVGLLTLIDYTLIGGLITIIIYSGHENFIEKLQRERSVAWPEWMSRVSFSGMKLKLFGSMMAISGITLLKALMKLEISVSEAQVRWLVVANVIFVIAYGVIAVVDHFCPSHEEEGEEH